MIFEIEDLVWFLLPLAAISGWLVARLEYKRRNREGSFDLPSAYFKGLNYLLNEESDKAIESFIKVLEVNTETVETHLALGNLFRRRGEMERAIRIHQNLVSRSTLDPDQKAVALTELGRDYLKAGLYDRAEDLFNELAEDRRHAGEVLPLLVQIYEREREWHKAIQAAGRLEQATGKNMGALAAQYYCELSEEARKANEMSSASKFVAQALEADPNCVRASMLAGHIEARNGNHRRAIKLWEKIGEQDARFLGEVANSIRDSYLALNDAEGLEKFFETALNRHKTIGLMLAMSEVVYDQHGINASEQFVLDWLRRKPTVQGLYRLIELNIRKPRNENNEDLQLLKGIIGELKDEHEGYGCHKCGFRGRSMYWICPGCHQWDTVRPLSGE